MNNNFRDAEEIEAFKTDINLVDFALANGYEVHKSKDSHKWRAVKLVGADEVLIIHKGSNGHFLYFNPDDEKDKGTVVDFVMKKMSLNLGHARKFLRPYLGTALIHKPIKEESKDYSAIAAEIRKSLSDFVDRNYLHSRGITDATIEHEAFKGKIFNNAVFDDKTGTVYINTAFPITNENSLIGIEQKNKLPDFNKSFKNVTGLRASGLWISRNTSGNVNDPLDFILICESAEKCLAWHQLHFEEGMNCIYISTSGSITDAQIDLLQKVIDKRKPGRLVLGMDNDIAGVRFSTNIIGRVSRDSINNPVLISSKIVLNGKYDCFLKILFPKEKLESVQLALQGKFESVVADDQANMIEATIAFKNTREPLDKAQGVALALGDHSFFKVHLAALKDFNEDLEDNLI